MYLLGIDVGSVSTDLVLTDENYNVKEAIYLRTHGKPIAAIVQGFSILSEKYKDNEIRAVGVTGSGRMIASCVIGADVVKNEITAHAEAALTLDKDVKTIIEIGGQDSKIILLNNGMVTDFAMNTVCAAGTGSFLDRQAERLNIPIKDFGKYAKKSKNPARIAGRCAVFAESDMIHKQQLGYLEEDIIMGLCEALVRNYLNNVAKGKEIKPKIFFQGGVAANTGIKAAFSNALGYQLYVPEYYGMMGAIGVAILSMDKVSNGEPTKFKGFSIAKENFISKSFECDNCPNCCEIIKINSSKKTIGYFGDRCGKWSSICG